MSNDLKSTYNRIARDWFKDHQKDTWWVEGTDAFLSFLKPNASLLDVGCGAGVKSTYLAEKGFKVTGIDFSEKMIEIAQENFPSGRFFVKDIHEPLEMKEEFDGVFAQAILLHISKKDISRVLTNLVEALKPGGYLYVAVKGIQESQEEEQIVKENDYGYEYERFFSFYTLDEMKGYLENLGLKIVFSQAASSGKTEWIQMIAKK